MVRQYPHNAKWWEGGGDPGYDEDGNPIISNPTELMSVNCRYENFSKGGNRQTFKNRNGEDVLATGTIFMPKGSIVPERFEVVDLDASGVEMKLECLNVYHGQLNITIHTVENVGN